MDRDNRNKHYASWVIEIYRHKLVHMRLYILPEPRSVENIASYQFKKCISKIEIAWPGAPWHRSTLLFLLMSSIGWDQESWKKHPLHHNIMLGGFTPYSISLRQVLLIYGNCCQKFQAVNHDTCCGVYFFWNSMILNMHCPLSQDATRKISGNGCGSSFVSWLNQDL